MPVNPNFFLSSFCGTFFCKGLSGVPAFASIAPQRLRRPYNPGRAWSVNLCFSSLTSYPLETSPKPFQPTVWVDKDNVMCFHGGTREDDAEYI